MKMNILSFLKDCGLRDPLYPGKRLVHKLQQPGEFKSHCVVYNWQNPEVLRVEIKAGLSGRDMPPKELSKYPVSFQAPTFVEFAVDENQDNEEDGDEETGRGSASGGGKGFKKRDGDIGHKNLAVSAFIGVAEGKLPEIGKIMQLVIMGKQIAAEAMGAVIESLAAQIHAAKIAPTDLLAKAGKFITKYTPPAALRPRGDEDKVYKYDREKNEPMFGKPAIG